MRIGVSARLAKQALADLGGKQVNEIEEVWHGVAPPYEPLFAWLEGRAGRPESKVAAPFRPVMLAQAITEDELGPITPEAYAAEWKWDGIRVQAVREDRRPGSTPAPARTFRIPSPISSARSTSRAPSMASCSSAIAADGGIIVGTFADLQQRLNRKTVSAKLMQSHPAVLRAYDLLIDGAEDIRGLPFAERRKRLGALVGRTHGARLDLSPLLAFADIAALKALRADPPEAVIEGVMLKRWDSVYEPGRPKGPWFKWKRDPYTVDAVLMYAQRGHGKRSSYYSDYTFGVWTEADELVPVGKAYFGFTDEELTEIDRFVRNNTVNRFGPVREVVHDRDHGLVLEVAFEGLNRSTRHKSGLAMRFPRVARLRWDKPPAEADRIADLEKLIRE